MAMHAHVPIKTESVDTRHHAIMAWLSPSFPTGAFAYSHGLEYAISTGCVTDRATLVDWLRTILVRGSLWNDAVLFVLAHRGDDVTELAEALAGSYERHIETLSQGKAFARTVNALTGMDIKETALPVATAQASRTIDAEAHYVLPLYLHAQITNLISVAVRLVPLGQTDGQMALQSLFTDIEQVSCKALQSQSHDLGSSALMSDIAAMCHEDMPTRIFKT